MPTAFVDVSVVPMDSEVVSQRQTVVVDGARITWIGPVSEAVLPHDVQRVDGRGRFLMPGLADMHCHPTAEADLLLCLAHGVTSVRNMWGMPRHLNWRARVAKGELLGPDIHTTGPIIEGLSVRNRWALSAFTPGEAEDAVLATKDAGYSAVKVYDELSPVVYQAVLHAAAGQQLPVVGHVPFLVGLHGALAAGQRSIEHLYGYLDALRPERSPIEPPRDLSGMRDILFSAASVASLDLLPEVARATREAGTWNCPTLLIRRRWEQDPAALAERPEMRHQSPLHAERRRVMIAGYPRNPNVARVCQLNLAVVKALSDAGAGLLAGTDAGIPTIVFGASLHEELHLFVDAGLSPYQALRASTADAAAFLGETGEWGSVAVGRRADLLLVDGNPLVDVANAARIAGVMKRGLWLPAGELHARVDALTAGRRTDRRSPAPRPKQTAAPARKVAYDVEWSGHLVGTEELTIEATPGESRRYGWDSGIELFDWCSVMGMEAGRYRSEIDVDAAGRDRAAHLEYDGADGRHVVELTRHNGHVQINGTDPVRGSYERVVDVSSDNVIFANYLTALYARLGDRLRTLSAGQRMDLELFGPGLPPDHAVATSTIRAERLPEPDTDEPRGVRHYSFETRRRNTTFSGVLTCDAEGLLLELRMDASPTFRVRRSDPSRGSNL